MAVSRAQRREERRDRVVAALPEVDPEVALDLLEMLEIAWHDIYAEITPSDHLIGDVLLCSQGSLAELVRACRLALTDARDIHVWAGVLRAG